MKGKKIRAMRLLCCVLSMLMIAGCSVPNADSPNSSDSIPGNTKDSVIIASHQEFTILDPQNINSSPDNRIFFIIYNTLVEMDYEKGELYSDLAESYKQLSDTEWQFNLRKGVKFHDGSEMTAEDVKFSLDRAKNSAVVASKMNGVKEVQIVDDYTIKIILESPNMAFLYNLFHTGCSILPKKLVEEQGEDEFFKHPVGTGPYKFESWSAGEEIVMTRFDDYYDYDDSNPNKTLTFRVMPESSSRMIALESGEVDIVDYIAPVDVEKVSSNSELELLQNTGLDFIFLGLNCSMKPFDNVKVRQALAYAINKDDVVTGVLEGLGQPATTVVGPTIAYYYDGMDTHQYNLEKAKELLAEAGYPDGFTMELVVRDDDTLRTAQILQNNFAQINVTVDIKQLEYATYTETCADGRAQAYLGSHANAGDTDNSLRPLFYSTKEQGTKNWHKYSNPEVDAKIDEANQTSDTSKREELYKELQTILVDECPIIPIYSQTINIGVRKGIAGVYPIPHGINHYENAHYE